MTSDPRALLNEQRQTLAPHIRELIEDTDTSADIGLVIELAARWGMAVDAVLRECGRLDGLVTGEVDQEHPVAAEIRRAITTALEGAGRFCRPADTGKETDR